MYAAYGRGFLVVFVLFLIGLRGFYVATYDRLDWQRLPGFGLAFVGCGLNVLGNLGDYWLGQSTVEQFLSILLFFVGTVIGTVALLSGVMLIGGADEHDAGIAPMESPGLAAGTAPRSRVQPLADWAYSKRVRLSAQPRLDHPGHDPLGAGKPAVDAEPR